MKGNNHLSVFRSSDVRLLNAKRLLMFDDVVAAVVVLTFPLLSLSSNLGGEIRFGGGCPTRPRSPSPMLLSDKRLLMLPWLVPPKLPAADRLECSG